MTPRQAAAVARLSSFVDAYTRIPRGLDPEYVYSLGADPKGDRLEQIRISDLRALLAMVSPITTTTTEP
jgi:hypothetical protein